MIYEPVEKANIIIAEIIKDFKPEFKNIRIYGSCENPLFTASDIGHLLRIRQINRVIQGYDEEERLFGVINKDGSDRYVGLLTLHGLYRTLFSSRGQTALLFRKFVYKILDKLRENENVSRDEVIEELAEDEPELLLDVNNEMKQRFRELHLKYENEHKERCLWKLKARQEGETREEIARDLIEAERNIRILQLQISTERSTNEEYVSALEDDTNCNMYKELMILKKTFMKPCYVYLMDYATITRMKTTEDGMEGFEPDEYSLTDIITDGDYRYYSISMVKRNRTTEYLTKELYVLGKKHFDALQEVLTITHPSGRRHIYITSVDVIEEKLKNELFGVDRE